MLTLICGSALESARAALLAPPIADDILFVVPDDLTAQSLAIQLEAESNGLVDDQRVVDMPTLLDHLTGSEIARGSLIPHHIKMGMLRSIIESDSKAFDYLVGFNSVPRLTQGVLRRIEAALDKLESAPASGDEANFISPRERQLRLLGNKMEARLVAGSLKLEKHGILEALARVQKPSWAELFPGKNHVVFLDFLTFSDTVHYLINAVRRVVKRCDVLLDFDPESTHSNLESAYQKLYDTADHIVFDQADSESGQLGLFEATNSPDAQTTTVVTSETVSREINGAVAIIRRLLDASPANEEPTFVIALTNHDEYAARLEQELVDFGISAVWHQSVSPLSGGVWKLFERLRDASLKWSSGSTISALWRAPGFSQFVDCAVNPVEAWNLASRMDYVLTLTGELAGSEQQLVATERFLKRLHLDRRKQGQLTDEETALDERLLEVLRLTQHHLAILAGSKSVKDWASTIIRLLDMLAANNEETQSASENEVTGEMRQRATDMAIFDKAIAPDLISFSSFIALYRTVLYDSVIDNSDELGLKSVAVCNPLTAAKLRSDCCLVLGCNDGSLPKFAKPDADFLGSSTQIRQATFRLGQRLLLDKIITNHKRVLLWMPARAGTEERLPSQFVEELLTGGLAGSIKVDDLLTSLNAQTGSAGRAIQKDLAENLKGLLLDEGDLSRFQRRGKRVHNIVRGTSLIAGRNHPELGEYDGIITDPVLREWLMTWAERHIYSVSQLDTVVGCSFRFFADRMLNLEELEEADDLLPAHTFGSFTHDVLSRFYRGWVAEGRSVPRFEEESVARSKLYEAYKTEHAESNDLSDFARDLLNLKLFGDLGPEGFATGAVLLEDTVDPGVFGQFLLMEMKRGSEHELDFLKPSNFEVGFGMGMMTEDDPLTHPEYLKLDMGEGEVIKLRGRIDRIDVSETGVFAVTDYKTGRLPEKKHIIGGLRTQLPVYILVGNELLKAKFEHPEPAGGLYYSLKRGDDVKVNGAFFRSAYQKQAGIQGRGLKDEDFEATLERVKGFMRHSLQAVRRGYLTTTWRDSDTVCKFCSFEGLCYRNVDRTAAFWNGLSEEQPAEID